MHKYIPAGALCALALAGTISAPPSAAVPSIQAAAEAAADSGSFTVRLVDIPADLVNDTRARHYIIDNLQPGTTIRRRVEVANTSDAPAQVEMYPGAARIMKGSFLGAQGKSGNELTSWTSLDKKKLEVPAHSTARMSVTIKVPRDAAPGERYATVWAQMSGGHGPGVTLVNRAGIRMYLSVGGHNPPPTNFTVDTMTAERNADGRAIVRAQVHNTGGRALDLSGTLKLSKVSGNINAGPYAVQLGTTLAPGQSEAVKVLVTDQVADGPWNAVLELKSGLTEKSYHARIAFPHNRGSAPPVTVQGDVGSDHMTLIGALAGLLLGAILPIAVILRRRKTAAQNA
ncbi:DUF916 domain-containing protein [Streptomyces sp. NBC_01210]|uniref:hypothetical protein n=1 Tax=Streptomyces sp. NBC_01210 TaxID=2903774 RepID=UPI002E0E20D3|nr:DUF916 domain-containing protein [Streptomyces sp. NBC_01210]